jgi:hypothetical protein
VGGVFAIVARVLECALRGECRYRRQHEHTEPTQEAITGVLTAGHWGGGTSGDSNGPLGTGCRPSLTDGCQNFDDRPTYPEPPDFDFGNTNLYTIYDLDWLGARLYPVARAAGYPHAEFVLVGSRVTGVGYKSGQPVSASSDWDIGVVDRDLYEYGRSIGLTEDRKTPGSLYSWRSSRYMALWLRQPIWLALPSKLEVEGREFVVNQRTGQTAYPKITYKVWRDIHDVYNAQGPSGLDWVHIRERDN